MNFLPRIISIWGKGGVGKSTIASALSLYLASNDFKVLLLTTDFVPTISKIFNVKVTSASPVCVQKNLWISELSPEDVIELWKERFGDEVYEVISSILPVDKKIIDYIAGAPGLSDEFMLYMVYEICRNEDYDFVIWDLPAAGDALRLLKIEIQFYNHLGDAVKMYLKLKGFIGKIKRKTKSSPLNLINEWRRLAEDIFSMLSSKEHVAYVISTPEVLSFEVTKRIISTLDEFNITTGGIIVNMLLPNNLVNDRIIEDKLKLQKRILGELNKLSHTKNVSLITIPYLTIDLSNYLNLYGLKNYFLSLHII